MWFEGILRIFFLFIDKVIYWAVEVAYNLFHSISMTGLFTPDTIKEFGGRIYVLLGVFMLFKVSFSLITYILNPDQLTDKSKGMSKLLIRIIISLLAIVLVPYGFQAAYSLQAIVLENNVIGSLVMGMNAQVTNDSNEDYITNGGKLMTYTTLSAFIRLNPDVVGEECANNPVLIDDSGIAILNTSCDHEVFETEVYTGETVGTTLIDIYSDNDITPYFSTNFMSLKAEGMYTNEDDWLFDYSILISSVAGGFLAWILLMFCFDIALRSVKLGFLQLVAPIPIISYVDPKGDKIFNSWLKECGKTYADLFIRLVGIYFVIFIISEVITEGIYNIVDPRAKVGLFVKVFIIFGALLFAKQLPDLISSILGIKLPGGFTLNPMNKLQQVPLVGAGATNLLGRTAGAWEAAQHDQVGNKWRAAVSGWFAAGSALHGKVPLMGAKPGSATVRSIHTGREAGFEVATGNKMKPHVPFREVFKEAGENSIADYKKAKEPLQQKLNQLDFQKRDVTEKYKELSKKLEQTKQMKITGKTVEERRQQAEAKEREIKSIEFKINQKQLEYQSITEMESKINKDIKIIDDQIKDITRTYDIDESSNDKLSKSMGHLEKQADGSYVIKDGAYEKTSQRVTVRKKGE